MVARRAARHKWVDEGRAASGGAEADALQAARVNQKPMCWQIAVAATCGILSQGRWLDDDENGNAPAYSVGAVIIATIDPTMKRLNIGGPSRACCCPRTSDSTRVQGARSIAGGLNRASGADRVQHSSRFRVPAERGKRTLL
jgi:hypothetical protein